MNVAAANPEVVAKIAAMMADAHEPSKVFPLPLIDDPKIEEQTVTTPPS